MKNILKSVIFFSLIGLTGACSDMDNIDELESKILDKLPTDPDVDQQSFCKGVIATESSSLNIRTSPELGDNICTTLPKDTPVIISVNGHENGFFKIQTTMCGDDIKWVYASDKYVDIEDSCLDDFNHSNPKEPIPDLPGNEGGENEDEKNSRGPDSDLEAITNLKSYIRNKLTRTSTRRKLTKKGSIGHVEVFKLPGSGTRSICGSKHIRSNRTNPHMAQDTLCAWTAITQEWAKTTCPKGRKNCRIMLGDSSFGKRQPSNWPHSTHRRGWCMDIWPMRKKNCGEKEVTWRSSCYDRTATKKFVKLLIKHGADKGNQFFFNDPKIPETRRLSNHDDHIHVCFKPTNSRVKRSCANTRVDRNVCSEFK